MRNPGSRELRRRQARLESQQRSAVMEQAAPSRREDVLRRGGLLEGVSPAIVTRVALLVGVVSLALLAGGVIALLVEIGQKDVVLGAVVLILAVGIVALVGSIAAPALRAARRDRKVPTRNLQGQLVGASQISATPGLATLAVSVGRQVEQFRVRPELFERVKTGATVVGISVTPGLNYVQSLTVIRRDRLAAMTTPPVTRAMRVAVWLPLASIVGIVAGLALGGVVGTLLPLGTSADHALVTLLIAAVLAGGVTLFSRWYGKRMMRELGIPE